MAVEGAPQESLGLARNDPKVVAALVNRFIADSAGFLQDFAQQCEAKLFDLSKRIHRLQRLIELFEHKIELLEPADIATPVRGDDAARGAPAAATSMSDAATEAQPAVTASAPGVSSAADAASGETEAEAAAPPVPVLDEKYQKYKRMHRAGVPLLAIRQRLLIDAVEDPSLDVSVLDTFGGAAGLGAGSPAPRPKAILPRPAAADAAAGAARPVVEEPRASEVPSEPQAEATATSWTSRTFTNLVYADTSWDLHMEDEATKDEPKAQELQPAPAPPINPSDMTLAEAVAASARRRQEARNKAESSAVAPTSVAKEKSPAPAPAINGLTAAARAAPQPAPREPPTPKPKPKPAAKAPEAKGGGLAAAILATPKLPSTPERQEGSPALSVPAKAAPPPPPKAKASAAAAKAVSPEAALRLRRSIAADSDDGEQSDVSDF
mmetsp:Transcript_118116/g.227812  ORF Transcript_118116/g.227812 Transcript_118116/m.227812 type:complete len:438 (+) Transcript_118116:72-1385(+)